MGSFLKSKNLQIQKIELTNRVLSFSSFHFLLVLIATGSYSLSTALSTTIFQNLSTVLSSPSSPCLRYPGQGSHHLLLLIQAEWEFECLGAWQ